MRVSRHLLLGAITALALAGIATAQQPGQAPNQPPPVFRSGAYLVFVDAYPRRDGHVVEGLAASDFAVLEDGKPQTVRPVAIAQAFAEGKRAIVKGRRRRHAGSITARVRLVRQGRRVRQGHGTF